jgi:hypothetical protein
MGVAASTTLNAAILTGTVPSDEISGVFDGGYFNAVRLIEDWTGRTMTFRGAIATPFASRHANEPWRGFPILLCEPPTTRVFSYESSFNPGRLPKGTPMLHTLIRGELVRRSRRARADYSNDRAPGFPLPRRRGIGWQR